MRISLLCLILLLPGMSQADNTKQSVRSVGKLVNDDSIQLANKLSSAPVIETDLKDSGSNETINSEIKSRAQDRLANHGTTANFEIFDAWVELTGDLDNDAYYHNLTVTLDADVDAELETVYVKLYLSREGGPWYQYATSDLFEIHYDSTSDTYEILTELIEGYEPGYYDVLIELHSLYHSGVVASSILNSSDTGFAIALEDLQHDDYYRDEYDDHYYESYGYGVSGSFSIAGLFLLSFLVLIKVRFFTDPDKKQ